MERKRWLAVAAVVAGTLAAGCHREERAPAPARAVRLQRIGPTAAEGDLRYSASVQPAEQVAVAFKVGGYVRELARRDGVDGRSRPLQQGDVVRQGTFLARVGSEDDEQRLLRARAQRASAVATLARARADAGRAEKLYAVQSLTRVDYDAARASLEVAAASLEAADAELESAAIRVRDAALRAPLDGLVLSRGVEVGTLASPGMVAFVLADVRQLKAVFGVPERVARGLEVGRTLELGLESSPAPVPGRITAVAPSADAQSRVFAVEVTIPNPDGRLRAGTVATVRVPSGAAAAGAPRGPAVPLSAVVRSPRQVGAYAVFVVEEADGRRVARAREVELGPIAGNLVHVAAGLERSERVVVTGASLLSDGEQVEVLE